MTGAELKQRFQITLSEGVVLTILGGLLALTFNAGIQYQQVKDLRTAQSNNVTKAQFNRLEQRVASGPERLARLETQVTSIVVTLERIDQRLEARTGQ